MTELKKAFEQMKNELERLKVIKSVFDGTIQIIKKEVV